MIAKSVSIKDAGGKSGARVSKAVELIAGDLLHVLALRLKMKQFIMTLQQKLSSGRSTHGSEGGPNSESE
jgi:hypothetical protein